MRTYGDWAGNPKGVPENMKRCAAEVSDEVGWHHHQCRRKRGYGSDGALCRQHALMKQHGRHIYMPEDRK